MKLSCAFRPAAALALAAAPAAPQEQEQEQAERTQSPPLELVVRQERFPDPLELEPVLTDDTLLVATTDRLYALDAATCAPRWSAGAEGWDELESEDRRRLLTEPYFEHVLLRPAAGAEVAVAVLQIPITPHPMRVSTAERRLFAFDLATGALRFDERSADLLPALGMPVVEGEHVLLPCASAGATLDHVVACHRLADGVSIWTTPLVDAATASERLGHWPYGLFAPPLTVAPGGELVIAQTDLGEIAALELATGAVRWRTRYAAMPPLKKRSYHAPRRDTVWRSAGPLVVGDVVLATPADSHALLALDLATGELLWSRRQDELAKLAAAEPHERFDHLAHASDDVLYLGGSFLARFTLPGGLHEDDDLALTWRRTSTRDGVAPRVRASDGALHSPGAERCERFDAASGTTLDPLGLDARLGLLVTEDACFGVGLDRITRLAR